MTQPNFGFASGTITTGITATGITGGTVAYTCKWQQVGAGYMIYVKVAPSAGASLAMSSGWAITLTGLPTMPDDVAVSICSADGVVGRGSGQLSCAAGVIYGGTAGAFSLGANMAVTISGVSI